MVAERSSVEVLLIQFWINDAAPLVTAIEAAGLRAHVKRVDIEPAIFAALGRVSHDLVIFDPSTPGITLELVQTCMREHASKAALAVAGDGESLKDAIAGILRRRHC